MLARLKALREALTPSRGDLGAAAVVAGTYGLFGSWVALCVAGVLLILSEVAG